MTTTAFSSDRDRLAAILIEHPVEVSPLRPQTVGVYMIEIHIKSADLRAMAAVNNALQLAFEAAAVSVSGDEGEPTLALELIWGGAGSWREVVLLNPRTSKGRELLNLIVYLGIQGLTCIEGVPPTLPLALSAIFVGSMFVAIAQPDLPTLNAETVDSDALTGVEVTGTLYPPGRAWRPSSGASRLSNLGEYVTAHEDEVHFATIQRTDGAYDIGLIVDGGILEKRKATAVTKWFAQQSDLPFDDITSLDNSDTGR